MNIKKVILAILPHGLVVLHKRGTRFFTDVRNMTPISVTLFFLLQNISR